jgi:hypothetical protein
VLTLLETLCKDFLECIITNKTYEISMRHVEIKNLNKVRDPFEMTPAQVRELVSLRFLLMVCVSLESEDEGAGDRLEGTGEGGGKAGSEDHGHAGHDKEDAL